MSRATRRLARACSGVVLSLLVGAGTAWAARTVVWTASAADLARGEADGVAITAQGALFPAPTLTRLGTARITGEPIQVWAMTADERGNLYLGTGPDGRVIRVEPSGKQTVHFSVDEPLVSALAIAGDGALLVGTSPGGRVYRVRSSGQGEVWSETGERYVWSLAVGTGGTVWVGTGERGAVLRLHGTGRADPFFDSDEAHIVSLLPAPDGGLFAGGAGRGLVYRIDREGNGTVLYEDDMPEATALASEADGAVLAAFLAPPVPETKPPILRLRLPDGVQVGTTNENVGALEESQGPVLQGFIEGLPGAAEAAQRRPLGRLVRIRPDGRSEELWSSTDEAPFSLVQDAEGRVLFGCGEPARLYRVAPGGDIALLTTLREAQITGLLAAGRSLFVATSNPAAIYRLEGQRGEAGVFVSRPIDAGAPARWGALRWRPTGSQRPELYTRTGNTRDPDGTWSAWSPALTDPENARVVNPDGRYLQWRVRFPGASAERAGISAISVHYEPYNRAPRIRAFRPVEHPNREAPPPPTFGWESSDPDGDDVHVSLEYRTPGATGWQPATWLATGGSADPVTTVGWSAHRRSWDTTAVVEGAYEVRAVASDEPSNHTGEGYRVPAEPALRVVVDRTPPAIDVRRAGGGRFDVTVSDAHSEIQRLEILADGTVERSVRPLDGVCDSRRETFRVELPEGAAAGRSLRGFDAAGNRAEVPLPQ